jgi:hypothetical protein
MKREEPEYSREHCERAIDACRRLAGMKQHPFSKAFWEETERLWVERLDRTKPVRSESN